MPLLRSIACSGLPKTPGAPWAGPREALAWIRSLGARAVQLDAAGGVAAIRPRDMDRSARRDLASLLRREALALSGLDLWIPPEHFIDPSRMDRALAACVSSLEFAAEVALESGSVGLHVAVMLPPTIAPDSLQHLSSAAARVGCALADFARPIKPIAQHPGSPIGYGIDPAAILLAHSSNDAASTKPVELITDLATLPGTPRAARWSDASAFGRIAVGAAGGRLDPFAYEAVLETKGFQGAAVIDVRGTLDPEAAARAGLGTPS